MKHALRWLLPALVAVETALVWSGLLDLKDAVLIVAGVEALLIATGIGEVVLVARRYRRGRASGLGFWAALEDGLALIMPRPFARLAVSEPRLFGCLFRWIFRRTRPLEGEFGYHKRSQMIFVVVLVLLTFPVELLVFEILAPWAWLRWTLLILGVYGIFWLLGIYASLVALPHSLEGEGLRLRYGLFAEALVPYAQIKSVGRKGRKAPKQGDGLQTAPGEDAAYLAISGKTDLALRLGKPLAVGGFFKKTAPVGAIHVAADEPERLARELERRVGEAAGAVSAAAASAG